jgi:hypothetical protein
MTAVFTASIYHYYKFSCFYAVITHFTKPADIFLTIQCKSLMSSIPASTVIIIVIIVKKSVTGNNQSAFDIKFLNGVMVAVSLLVTSGSAIGNRLIKKLNTPIITLIIEFHIIGCVLIPSL